MKLLKDRFEYKAGTVVYYFTGPTYGLAEDDSLVIGIEHTSVTVKPDGSGPFFTVPTKDIELISND